MPRPPRRHPKTSTVDSSAFGLRTMNKATRQLTPGCDSLHHFPKLPLRVFFALLWVREKRIPSGPKSRSQVRAMTRVYSLPRPRDRRTCPSANLLFFSTYRKVFSSSNSPPLAGSFLFCPGSPIDPIQLNFEGFANHYCVHAEERAERLVCWARKNPVATAGGSTSKIRANCSAR